MAQRILVVDDDKNLVEIYRRTLKRAGYEVICAYNGKEGLDALRANPVDLVILDLKMPKMGGDKFLAVLRRDSRLKDTKVLVMSSLLYKYTKMPSKYIEGKIDTIRAGKTRLGRRAEKLGKGKEKFEMKEKKSPKTETFLGFQAEESESKFRRRISVDLVRKVKEVLSGEKEEIQKEDGQKKPEKEITGIEERVKNIILKYVTAKREELTPDTSFTKDLGVDSLETIEMMMEAEEEFGMEISDEDAEKLTTVGKAIEYIKTRLKEKNNEG